MLRFDMKEQMALTLALIERMSLSNFFMPHRDYRARGTKKHRKTGKTYPHSSTRQRARYARQMAAGQLNMERVNGY